MLSLETPRKEPRPRLRRAAARRWIGRCCTGRRTNCTVLIPTTTSSGWITKSGTGTLRQETLRLRNTRSDEAFLSTLERNQEWVDLELLLRELNELGARPLLLSMPIHGGWYDHCGDHVHRPKGLLRKATRDQCPLSRSGRRLRRSRCRSVLLPRSPWGTSLPVGWCITTRSSTVFSTTRSHASPSSPPLHPWRAEGPKPVSRPGDPRSQPPYEGFHDPFSATAIETGRPGRTPNQSSREEKP